MLKINKRIKWIMATLLAAILLILPGCDNESPLDTLVGSTTLRLSMKGIMVNPDPNIQDVDWEVYVKTLRLIGFQEGKQVVNHKINNLSSYKVQGTAPDTYIEIPLNENIEAAIKKGTLNLFAVANEEDANFTDNTFPDNITAQQLEALEVTAKASYNAPDADNPFLMSAQINTTLVVEESSIDVKLVRTVGKVELHSVKLEDQTEVKDNVTSYSLSATGNVYVTYPLFTGTGTGTGAIALNNATATDTPLYLSEAAANTVTIEVAVTYDGKEYKGSFSDEQIIRNRCIQINATIKQAEENNCLLLESTIQNWIPKELKPEYN